MTWQLWVLEVAALLIVLIGVTGLLARSLFHKGMALARELGEAGDRVAAVTEQVEALAEARRAADEPVPPAVFADPARMRVERAAARSARARRA